MRTSFLSITFFFCVALAAQEDVCSDRLEKARAHYELGRFKRVETLLATCLKLGFNDEEKIEAFALLAKSYLAVDSLDQADKMIIQLLLFSPRYQAGPSDPRTYRERVLLYRNAREGREAVMVTSVSKSAESQQEAPAPVQVITREDIVNRGYQDVAAMLHDLPGFDMQQGNGEIYANFNQRGYRSINDRTLVLVDGVEANDLWRNVVFLSRQYPIGNIERVEVIYGPASTMYGPNAFVGVINLVTREPERWVGEGKRIGAQVQLGGGPWNTRYTDTTLAWKHAFRNISVSLTTRIFQSDEPDLSGYEYWDYDPAFYDTQDYSGLGTLDPVLIELARQYDKEGLDQLVEGQPVGFSDKTDDYAVQFKLRMGHFSLGFLTWRREEGYTPWYTDDFYPGSENGSVAAPEQVAFWMQYRTHVSNFTTMSFLAQFKRHRFGSGSQEEQFLNYASGDLNLENLLAGVRPYFRRTTFDESSRQIRGEAKLNYQPSTAFNVVAGVEVRQSLLQGNYILNSGCPDFPDGCPRGEILVDDSGQFFSQLDLGIYGQASWQMNEDWKVVGGLRYDRNESSQSGGAFLVPGVPDAEEPEGYGDVVNPRLSVVYSPGAFVFKAIYAEAFKDPSQWDRYATAPGFRDIPSPNLPPEKVKNYDISASWQKSGWLLDGTAFQARYSNGVSPQEVPFGEGTTLQNKAIGSLKITGAHLNLLRRFKKGSIYGNVTWTDPRNEMYDLGGGQVGTVRITDIASYQAAAGVTGSPFEKLTVHLRAKWSGPRKVGEGTTNPSNPLKEIDDYLVFNSTVTYQPPRIPGMRLQLMAQNLSDASYEHPGAASADGRVLAPAFPQPERAFFLRLIYDF